jgi:hypothetical protein
MPGCASRRLAKETKELKEFEKEYGTGEIFGFTYIYCNDVKEITKDFQEVEYEWKELFDLIEKFKSIKTLDDNQIRLVVWFTW